jgi:putative MATE family efflux protein
VSAPLVSALDVPVPRALLRLALPILASQALRLAYQWVDALWVRGLGVEATAAVTTTVFVMWWVLAVNDVVAVGVTAFVSQLLGARQRDRAGVAARKGIVASAALGLLGTLAGLVAAEPIYRVMDPSGAVVAPGTAYLRVLLLGAPLPMVALTCENVMRAAGNTRVPLLIDLAAVGLNAVIAPFLIYGWGPFPRLEVEGAALATVISQAALCAGYALLAWRGHEAFPLARRAAGPPVGVAALARVGLPASLIGILFSVAYIAFTRAASREGPAAVAVVGMVNRIEAIEFVLAVSCGWAGASLLGQSLGAGRPDRAEQVLRTGQRWIGALAAAIAVVYVAVPDAFLRLFTQDAEAIRLGVPYMRVLAVGAFAAGLEIVTAETLMGSGHTRVISTIYNVFSVIRVPLAFVVPEWTGTGVMGIAWIISGTAALRTALIMAWAARGSWRSGLSKELGAAPAGVSPPASA